MIQQKEITLDGDTYMITQFPATKGIKILKQIVKLVGPSFAELSKASEGKAEADVVSVALDKLFDNLDEVDVEALVKELVSGASKNSVSVNFDMEFAGKYEKLFKLVREIVEFNYGSVFTLVGSGF